MTVLLKTNKLNPISNYALAKINMKHFEIQFTFGRNQVLRIRTDNKYGVQKYTVESFIKR